MPETKPGWKTTEFWVTVLVAVSSTVSAVAGVVPPVSAAIATAIAGSMYAVARAITKANDLTPGQIDPNAPLTPPGK